jgi:hypothetical protein
MAAAEQSPVVTIDRIEVETIDVPITGTTPLIMHRFSEKAKRQMLDNMQGRKSPKTAKDPEAEYEAAFYRFADGSPGCPAVAFKAAIVEASRFYGKSVTKVGLRQFVFIKGEVGVDGQPLVRITGEPRMREDVVRVGMGTDLRYRPEFPEWSTTLRIVFVTSAVDRASVLSLIDAAGMGVGVGEWRPERKGDFGCFEIDQNRDVEVVA